MWYFKCLTLQRGRCFENCIVAVQKGMAVPPAQGSVTELLTPVFLYSDTHFFVASDLWMRQFLHGEGKNKTLP